MNRYKKMKVVFFFFLSFSFANYLPKGVYLLSAAVLPGSGQLLLRERLRGEVYLLTDGLLFLSFIASRTYGKFINQDAVLFAAWHSGANQNKKGDEYYKILEEYNSSNEYNEIVLREGRNRYPDDPEKQKDYLTKNGYFGEDSWQWASDSARIDYWRMRRRARNYHLRAKFFFAGNLLLRAISVFDCSYLFDKKRRLSYEFQIQPELKLGLSYKF